MNAIEQYIKERDEQVRKNMKSGGLSHAVDSFTEHLVKSNYIKNFTWMGVPILQYPTDLMVMQELLWQIKPDVIVEIGTAFGGMLMFYASILESIEGGGCPMSKVLGVDIDIRRDNSERLLYGNPLAHRIELFEGSSIDIWTKEFVESFINNMRAKKVLISLDSNHTHSHVLQELNLYSSLVSVGSYIIVFDTSLEFYGNHDNREWGKGNSPYTAIQEFLKDNDSFVVDKEIEQRAIITSAIGGWLKRIK